MLSDFRSSSRAMAIASAIGLLLSGASFAAAKSSGDKAPTAKKPAAARKTQNKKATAQKPRNKKPAAAIARDQQPAAPAETPNEQTPAPTPPVGPAVHYHYHYPPGPPVTSSVPPTTNPTPPAANPSFEPSNPNPYLRSQNPTRYYPYNKPGNANGASAYPSWMYPGYATPFVPGGPMASFPLTHRSTPPTPAQPYPRGYGSGPFAPLPFDGASPTRPQDQEKGVIDVFLPVPGAEVYLNGQHMRGTGTVRRFTTPPLPPNKEYQYYVTVAYDKGGKQVVKYRKTVVGAGDYIVVDFKKPPLDNPVKLPSGPVSQNDAYPEPEQTVPATP